MTDKTPEQQAQDLGWRPKESWTGPEGAWKDAETFLKDGERIAGFQKKKYSKDLEERERDFEERLRRAEQANAAALEFQQAQAAKEKAELIRDLQAKRAAAIEDNDLATLERVKDQIEEVKSSGPRPEDIRAATDFKAKHGFWQGRDYVLDNFAAGVAGQLKERGLPPSELFAELDRQLRETFPEKFGRNKRPNAVESDAPNEQPGDEKTFAGLPKEAKEAYAQLAQKIKGFTKEQYTKGYYEKA